MTRPPGTPRALVVDDDPDIRDITEIALATVAGWDVRTAAGGREAIAHAQEHDLDVIVMDLMMPGMDGITAFHELQRDERSRGVPVVLLTAKGTVGDQQPWDGVPLAGVVSKPFSPMTLAAQLTTLLGWDTEG